MPLKHAYLLERAAINVVGTMVMPGNATIAAVRSQISALGTNILDIRPSQGFGRGDGGLRPSDFEMADHEAISQRIGEYRSRPHTQSNRCNPSVSAPFFISYRSATEHADGVRQLFGGAAPA